jgi:hypothetical protein
MEGGEETLNDAMVKKGDGEQLNDKFGFAFGFHKEDPRDGVCTVAILL